MHKAVPVLLLLALFVCLCALMAWGWRSRARRFDFLPPLPAIPSDHHDARAEPSIEAIYVSTVIAGKPLERVVTHGLGARSRARVSISADGSWCIHRDGAPSFSIPAEKIELVAPARAMAGKALGTSGLVVVRWQHGPEPTMLDTGVRIASPEAQQRLLTMGQNAL